VSPLKELLALLPDDLSGAITPARLIDFLKKLPQGQPIAASVSHSGQEWYLNLNLSDLK
jgi:hypothetical protein